MSEQREMIESFRVPAHMLGEVPEPRCPWERTARELEQAEAFVRRYGVDLTEIASDAALALDRQRRLHLMGLWP